MAGRPRTMSHHIVPAHADLGELPRRAACQRDAHVDESGGQARTQRSRVHSGSTRLPATQSRASDAVRSRPPLTTEAAAFRRLSLTVASRPVASCCSRPGSRRRCPGRGCRYPEYPRQRFEGNVAAVEPARRDRHERGGDVVVAAYDELAVARVVVAPPDRRRCASRCARRDGARARPSRSPPTGSSRA